MHNTLHHIVIVGGGAGGLGLATQLGLDILPALERRGFLLQDGNVLPHTSPSH
jgi:NADH dehydrogenase FAD-containing subunit